MTLEQLEKRLDELFVDNIKFEFVESNLVEAISELSDGSSIGMSGRTFVEATEQLLGQLEQLHAVGGT